MVHALILHAGSYVVPDVVLALFVENNTLSVIMKCCRLDRNDNKNRRYKYNRDISDMFIF